MPKQNVTYTDMDLPSTTAGQVLTADGLGGASFQNPQGSGNLAVGSIVPFGGTTAPNGFLFCDGSAVSETTYAELFEVIGYNFGNPGGGNFNLPDMRQRFPLGKADSGTGSTLGGTGGTIDHTHSVPSHFHGTGDLAISSSGGHTTALDHDHGAFTSGSESSHTHSIAHNHAAFTSGSNSVGHTHSIAHNHASVNTSSAGSHTHLVGNSGAVGVGSSTSLTGSSNQGPINASYDASGSVYNYDLRYAGGYNTMISNSAGSHNHSVDLPNFTGNSGTQSANHTHNIDVPNFTGNSGAGSSHTHSIDVPNFTGNSSSSGNHTHLNGDFTGSVGNTGGVNGDSAMTSGTENPPFLAVNYIIKASNISSNFAVQELKSHQGYTNSGRIELTDAVQTTDATETTMTTLPVNDNTVMRFEVMVVARFENTGTNKSYWARLTGAVRRNNGGSAVLVGTREKLEDSEGTPGYTCDVDVSGNDLRIRVTGAGSETVNWVNTVIHQSVSLST